MQAEEWKLLLVCNTVILIDLLCATCIGAVVSINLKSDSMKTGKARHKQVKECLKRLPGPVNLVFCSSTLVSHEGVCICVVNTEMDSYSSAIQ